MAIILLAYLDHWMQFFHVTQYEPVFTLKKYQYFLKQHLQAFTVIHSLLIMWQPMEFEKIILLCVLEL